MAVAVASVPLTPSGLYWANNYKAAFDTESRRATVGDRVRVKATGLLGVVVGDDADAVPYKLRYDGGAECKDWLREDEVELEREVCPVCNGTQLLLRDACPLCVDEVQPAPSRDVAHLGSAFVREMQQQGHRNWVLHKDRLLDLSDARDLGSLSNAALERLLEAASAVPVPSKAGDNDLEELPSLRQWPQAPHAPEDILEKDRNLQELASPKQELMSTRPTVDASALTYPGSGRVVQGHAERHNRKPHGGGDLPWHVSSTTPVEASPEGNSSFAATDISGEMMKVSGTALPLGEDWTLEGEAPARSSSSSRLPAAEVGEGWEEVPDSQQVVVQVHGSKALAAPEQVSMSAPVDDDCGDDCDLFGGCCRLPGLAGLPAPAGRGAPACGPPWRLLCGNVHTVVSGPLQSGTATAGHAAEWLEPPLQERTGPRGASCPPTTDEMCPEAWLEAGLAQEDTSWVVVHELGLKATLEDAWVAPEL